MLTEHGYPIAPSTYKNLERPLDRPGPGSCMQLSRTGRASRAQGPSGGVRPIEEHRACLMMNYSTASSGPVRGRWTPVAVAVAVAVAVVVHLSG